MRWERPEPTAAVIGQAAGSSVSSSKWRHVRPVGLQLGPDCFPEALEASPCLSAHRGGRRVHPTVSGPDLSWHEKGPFSYGLMQAEECYTQTSVQTEMHRTAWWAFSCEPVHSCTKCALTGFSVFSCAYVHFEVTVKGCQSCESSLILEKNKKTRCQKNSIPSDL